MLVVNTNEQIKRLDVATELREITPRIASGWAPQRSAISAKSGDFCAKSAKQDAKTGAAFFGSASDDMVDLILAPRGAGVANWF
jgi:hypothetical protein